MISFGWRTHIRQEYRVWSQVCYNLTKKAWIDLSYSVRTHSHWDLFPTTIFDFFRYLCEKEHLGATRLIFPNSPKPKWGFIEKNGRKNSEQFYYVKSSIKNKQKGTQYKKYRRGCLNGLPLGCLKGLKFGNSVQKGFEEWS